jgi:hypothetical protein
VDTVISTYECSAAFRTLWRTLVGFATRAPTIVERRAFSPTRARSVPASWAATPNFGENVNNSHNQTACRALNLDCTKTRLTYTEAVEFTHLFLKSTFSMGSVSHSVKLRNPWIETPLMESRALSKAAGWYASGFHSSLSSLTLLASQ